MLIHEAAAKAAETDRCMIRKSVLELSRGILGNVKPTNSSECCLLLYYTHGRSEVIRCWNPTLADLTADDWVIVDNPILMERIY